MINADFKPLLWASNPHLQTVLPRLFRRAPIWRPRWQRLELPDGDFVDLAWSESPERAPHKPRLVLFHGLEGNFYSPYIHGLMRAAKAQGWISVVMHFRGCSGVPNRNSRIYHSGETGDASYFLQWLINTYGSAPTAAVGFSLGGNMLGCYLGEQGDNAKVDAAAIVSAPFMLEPCAHKLDRGFSRIYQSYLLKALKNSALRKLESYPNSLPISIPQINQLKRISEFDNEITAPLHHYLNASDYYQRCSAMPLLPKVRKPLLIIHAKDDPFMTPDVIPPAGYLPANIEYQLTEHGGHVGFIAGSWRHPSMWLEQRIPSWLTPYLEK